MNSSGSNPNPKIVGNASRFYLRQTGDTFFVWAINWAGERLECEYLDFRTAYQKAIKFISQ